jgi:hypothetical protein
MITNELRRRFPCSLSFSSTLWTSVTTKCQSCFKYTKKREVRWFALSPFWNVRKHRVHPTAVHRDSRKDGTEVPVQVKVYEGFTVHFTLRELEGVGAHDGILKVEVGEGEVAEKGLRGAWGLWGEELESPKVRKLASERMQVRVSSS